MDFSGDGALLVTASSSEGILGEFGENDVRVFDMKEKIEVARARVSSDLPCCVLPLLASM